MSRCARTAGAAAIVLLAGATATLPIRTAGATVTHRYHGRIHVATLSAGARAWFHRPTAPVSRTAAAPRVARGGNVDANDPRRDLAAGQAETAVAAVGSTVVAAWNDATGFVVTPSTDRRASLTGVALSTNGGRTFRDLTGLRNNRPNQQWFGDPTIVAIDAHHFAIGSLYLPSPSFDCATGPARFQVAVEILTISATGAASLGLPVVAADGGNFCRLLNSNPNDDPPDLALLDKEWLSYDKGSRRLGLSFTRFFFGIGDQSGQGQVELVRGRVPADPGALSGASFSAPVVVWPEEPRTQNTGVYVSMAPGGDAYLSWERNIDTNLFNGDPYVYIHAARVRAGDVSPVVGGPGLPRVVSLGQRHSNGVGGVRSLDAVVIAGYNRGLGQDFPRIAVDRPRGRVLVVWNDASAHPLGDIWLRALPMNLTVGGPISKVNDDSSFALHLFPAVSVRSDGSAATSWYDRRIGGASSTRTDYFGEVRATPATAGRDFRISTGSTDWSGTSTITIPNFGDYTDNASTGSTTYFTWTDGRLGVPQPFVDHR